MPSIKSSFPAHFAGSPISIIYLRSPPRYLCLRSQLRTIQLYAFIMKSAVVIRRTLCHHATATSSRYSAAAKKSKGSTAFVTASCQARQHDDITALHHQRNSRRRYISRCFASNADHSLKPSTTTYTAKPSSSSSSSTANYIPNEENVRVKILPLTDGITHVLLSRPSKLNSLDLPTFESIAEAASTVRRDRHCRVVILSGEGRAFCTGLDAKSVALEGGGDALDRLMDRPSGYGGDGDDGKRGNLAQDVGYLWR
eukprot:scaffold17626_cov47-Cyclotella_meneghiniana.AAC.1